MAADEPLVKRRSVLGCCSIHIYCGDDDERWLLRVAMVVSKIYSYILCMVLTYLFFILLFIIQGLIITTTSILPIQHAPLIRNPCAYAPHVCQEVQATWYAPPLPVLPPREGW